MAIRKCQNSYASAGVKSAAMVSTLTSRPPSMVTPPGVFIHELAASTPKAPSKPAGGSARPVRKCARGERRFQPYR